MKRTTHVRDLALVQRVREQDPEARDEFVGRLGCLMGFIGSRSGRLGLMPDETEEVVQEALYALWRRLGSYRGESSIETWACGFGLMQARKWHERKQRIRREGPLDDVDLNDSDDSPPAGGVEYEPVHEALCRLDSLSATIVQHKHYEGLTFDQIGARLELAPNTVKTRYYRALKKLQELLAPFWREAQP